jgi:beta-1,2-mannobiose phosphorylase / 1,2-beta-oligomannan phosphorylase
MIKSSPVRNFQLERYAGNPILSPLPGSPWQDEVVTNPAAWRDEESGEVTLLYRAAGHDEEHTVHLGLATSRDGLRFQRRTDLLPVLSPIPLTPDGGCIEDPRIIKIGEWYYVTIASRPFPPGRYWTNQNHAPNLRKGFPPEFPVALRQNLTSTHLFLTRDFKNWIRAGRMTDPSLDERDVVIFPEQVGGEWITLHRPMQWHGEGYPNAFPAIWIARSDDLLAWKQLQLLAKGEEAWELKIGANNPPLKTAHGWLQIYHGVGEDKQYRLGALLLDLDDPTVVTHRTRAPIYQPEAPYEKEGIYQGVCFPCGHVVIDGVYFLYYGGADVHCCVATCRLDELLGHLLDQPVAP